MAGWILLFSLLKSAHGQNSIALRRIDHDTQLLVARAEAERVSYVDLLIAAAQGQGQSLETSLRAMNDVSVERWYDTIEYLRLRVPLNLVPRILRDKRIEEVRIGANSSNYDRAGGYWDPPKVAVRLKARMSAAASAEEKEEQPLLKAGTLGQVNPYVPIEDMRIASFLKAHPGGDGRGVTIGIVENTVDPNHPALKTAYLAGGMRVQKVWGLLDARSGPFDPSDHFDLWGNPCGSCLTPIQQLNVAKDRAGNPLLLDGTVYILPEPGTYVFGHYIRRGSSNTSVPVAALWSPERRVFWLDADASHDFRRAKAVRDINEMKDAVPEDGSFFGELPALKTTKYYSIPQSYVISFANDDRPAGLPTPRLYLSNAGHETMVASGASGNGLFGNPDLTGSAPGARIISVPTGGIYTEIEGLIAAVLDPRVDLTTMSENMETWPLAGDSISDLIVSRLSRLKHKPMFFAASNAGPAISNVRTGAGSEALAIGAYESMATAQVNERELLPIADGPTDYSAAGPSKTGAMKPDVLAPTALLSANMCSRKVVTATYTTPYCYTMGGGTSNASPVASGAAAVLISAAKQNGLPYDAERIAWALRSGAKYFQEWDASLQGAGLIQVDKSWELLRSGMAPPQIEVSAPLNHVLTRYMRAEVDGVVRGSGLYEQEGWTAGQSEKRKLTLKRTTGAAAPVTYPLRWQGNDGTYSGPKEVTLPLNMPVLLTVEVAPSVPGQHAAELLITDAQSGVIWKHIAMTVVAALEPDRSNNYTVTRSDTAKFQRPQATFVRVPEGTASLSFALAVENGRANVDIKRPGGLAFLGDESRVVPQPRATWGDPVLPGESAAVRIDRPTPGTWEVLVYDAPVPATNKQPATDLSTEYVLTASLQTASAEAKRKQSALHVKWTSAQAPIAQPVTTAALGFERTVNGTVDAITLPPMIPITVASGTQLLQVSVKPLTEKNDEVTDLDLYLYDCTVERCKLKDVGMAVGDRLTSSPHTLLVRTPNPGQWRAIVMPARVRSGKTKFSYTEVQTNDSYGKAELTNSTGMEAEITLSPSAIAVPDGASRVVVSQLLDQSAEDAEKKRSLGDIPDELRPLAIGMVVTPLGHTKSEKQ